jgi:serine protease Do
MNFQPNGEGLTKTTNLKVNESSAVISAVKAVTPSVVSITGESQTVDFFGQVADSQTSGTGFVVSRDGLIITNKHVVSDASATYTVFTSDGKQYPATIKATDPSNDIAFLKINATNLPVATLGDSSNLEIGQQVVAIGNALGQYQNTVTAGIVSAVGRAIQAADTGNDSVESIDNVIQTDAAINPGNSGGPLINLAGQVIGMNTAVDQSGQSIGFAIPIDTAKSAINSVIKNGKVIRPMIGVNYIPITAAFATSNNLPVSQGAYIYASDSEPAVIAGSPAAKAGLQQGDIITKINNDSITSTQDLTSLITKYNVGDTIKVTYLRNSKQNTVNLVLAQNTGS